MAEIATVEMKQIRKEFPATLANDNVDFTAYKGEIHALLGKTAPGKAPDEHPNRRVKAGRRGNPD